MEILMQDYVTIEQLKQMKKERLDLQDYRSLCLYQFSMCVCNHLDFYHLNGKVCIACLTNPTLNVVGGSCEEFLERGISLEINFGKLEGGNSGNSTE